MKKLVQLCFWIVFTTTCIQAQTSDSLAEKSKIILFEKLYLRVDRDFYSSGDKIRMKVFHVNGVSNKLNSNYRNIFIQLIDENGKIVRDIMLLSIGGEAEGTFDTAKLPSGKYIIRAYTKYLKNYGEEACFHYQIWITDSSGLPDLNKTGFPDSAKIDVAFLPEGGQLIANAANTVAFKAIDFRGNGIFVSGTIRKESGETMTTFSTVYLGMGKFVLMPEDHTAYFATIDQFPGMQIPLPKPVSGISLIFKEIGNRLLFRLFADMKRTNNPRLYFVVSHKGTDLSHQKIELTDFETTISLEKSLLPNGISKVSLLDEDMNPFAERLIFVDNRKSDNIHLSLNKETFGTRDSVHLNLVAALQEGDSIGSNFLVAVVNANSLSAFDSRQTIRSYLLLDSELRGPIESPDSYFRNDSLISSSAKLDLLMLVHGWRSYAWDEISGIPAPPLEDWNDAGLNISGVVKKILWKSPVQDAEVTMDYVYLNFRIGKTTTDETGRFFFNRIFLIDTLKVMLNARTKNGTKNAEIILDSLPKRESEVPPGILANTCLDTDLTMDFIRGNSFRRMKEIEFNPEKGTILLEGIDILEKRSRAFARSFGEYPWADKTLIVTPEDYSFNYVFDYLEYNVPRMVRSGDSILFGTGSIVFTIDGMNADIRELLTVRMKDIDVIDVLYPGFQNGFRIGTLGAVDRTGLVAIYMKKPFKPIINYNFARGRIRPEINGYQSSPVFYSPKYTLQNINSLKPDFRPTLYWNPTISLIGGRADLNFYSSDEQANYVVFVEGISRDGRICFGKTTFSVNGR